MRRVTFRSFGEHLASSRLRALIPQRELAAMGVERGRDVLVIGKHGWNWDEETDGYKHVVFDICDDHFGHAVHGAHYMAACEAADAVTCNSREMARIIKARTNRDAWVIPDPWESPERPARVGERLLWFGHALNLCDLAPWLDALVGRDLTVVTGAPETLRIGSARVVTWSPESMAREFARAGMTIIPTGKSMAKSGNRAIESIRNGLFPVCGYLPAYADLGVWVGDIADGVEWVLSRQDEAVRRIKAAQAYVAHEYHPARIGKLWLEALSYV